MTMMNETFVTKYLKLWCLKKNWENWEKKTKNPDWEQELTRTEPNLSPRPTENKKERNRESKKRQLE